MAREPPTKSGHDLWEERLLHLFSSSERSTHDLHTHDPRLRSFFTFLSTQPDKPLFSVIQRGVSHFFAPLQRRGFEPKTKLHFLYIFTSTSATSLRINWIHILAPHYFLCSSVLIAFCFDMYRSLAVYNVSLLLLPLAIRH
jgi:hypothetical protein